MRWSAIIYEHCAQYSIYSSYFFSFILLRILLRLRLIFFFFLNRQRTHNYNFWIMTIVVWFVPKTNALVMRNAKTNFVQMWHKCVFRQSIGHIRWTQSTNYFLSNCSFPFSKSLKTIHIIIRRLAFAMRMKIHATEKEEEYEEATAAAAEKKSQPV